MEQDSVYRIALRQTLFGQQLVNTWDARVIPTAGATLASLATLADALKEVFRPNQGAALAYTTWYAVKLRGTSVVYNTSDPFRVSSISYEGVHTGTLTGAAGEITADSVRAVVISRRTAMSGRRYRGRLFMGGVISTYISSGLLTAAMKTSIQTNLNNINAAYGTAGSNGIWELGLFSDRIAMNAAPAPTHPHAMISLGAPSPFTAFTPYTSYVIRDQITGLNRRKIGVGT